MVVHPAAAIASICARNVSGVVIRSAANPVSPSSGLTRWYSNMGTRVVNGVPAATMDGNGEGDEGGGHATLSKARQLAAVADDDGWTSAASGASVAAFGRAVSVGNGIAAVACEMPGEWLATAPDGVGPA